LDETALDVDQVENLIKFCPTKEEIELLKVLDLFFQLKSSTLCLHIYPLNILFPFCEYGHRYFLMFFFCAIIICFNVQGYAGNKENLGKCEQVMELFF
jgi:hypothetical protein